MNWLERWYRREHLEDRLERELRIHFDCQVADNRRAARARSVDHFFYLLGQRAGHVAQLFEQIVV